VGRCELGEQTVRFSVGLDSKRPLQMERKYGQAFGAHHLTGLKTEDSIQGTRQISRGQGEAYSFSPVRKD
jgi:hypothetical protein